MSMQNLDSGQIAGLTMFALIVVIMAITGRTRPKSINRLIDKIDIKLTAKLQPYLEQRQTRHAQRKAAHPPKRTPEEVDRLRSKTGFLLTLGSFIGIILWSIILGLMMEATGNSSLESWGQYGTLLLGFAFFCGIAMFITSDAGSPPVKENTTTITAPCNASSHPLKKK